MPDKTPTGRFQTPRGVHDVLPDQHDYFSYIKRIVRHRFRQNGFRRISTPTFEELELFERGVGADTDIVSKELYVLEDREGKRYALRPEGTAGVVRSYIQHGMGSLPQPVQLYYVEPMFRYDRPQKGRYRQFHQFGCEIIGESDAALDAQVIHLLDTIHHDLGLGEAFTLQVNSIGCQVCRPKYVEDLRAYYDGKERTMCGECKERLQSAPLRVLDCKKEDCQILASMAPKLSAYLCEECRTFHENLLSYLDELKIKYVENPTLVRGLDYYTKTVFEYWDASEGQQNAVGGGGRYDGLVELLGGQPTPAVGFASGVERLILAMKAAGVEPPRKDKVDVFVAQLGPEAKKKSLSILSQLRNAGVRALGAVGKGSIKAQLRLADKFQVPWTIIIGELEVIEGKAILRDMTAGKQRTIPMRDILDEVLKVVPQGNLDIAER